MKQRLYVIGFLSLLLWMPAKAINIDSLFVSVPHRILSLLDQTAKMDLIDLYNGALPAKVENLYGGETFMLQKSPHFVKLQTTQSGTWTLAVYTCEHGAPFILCAYSVNALGTSTDIRTYNMDWSERKIQIPMPQKEHFICRQNDYVPSSQQVLMSSLLQSPVQVTVTENCDLKYELSISGLSQEYAESGQELIRPLIYQWNGTAFVTPK